MDRFSSHKTVTVDLADGPADLSEFGEVLSQDGSRITLRVPKGDTPRITGRLLASLPVQDLTVEDPSIEDAIDQVFREERV